MRRRGQAFTLIELLVVVAIIGILMSLGSYVWGSVAARSRDSTRKADLKRLQNTLTQYYTDQKSYPTFDTSVLGGRLYAAEWQLGNTGCVHGAANPRLVPTYLMIIPRDPQHPFISCSDKNQTGMYLYLSSNNPNVAGLSAPNPANTSNGYMLMATLENSQDPDLLANTANPISAPVSGYQYYNIGQSNDYGLIGNYAVTGAFGH